MRVGICGGTGLIGWALTQALSDRGDKVSIFSRRKTPPNQDFLHPSINFISRSIPEPQDIDELDALINLTGENLAGVRWTDAAKKKFYTSRVTHTENIVDSIQNSKNKLKVFISASAIGFYGSSEDTGSMFTEESPAGKGFLAELSVAWEKAAENLQEKSVRVVIPRIGIVLDPRGGALSKLLPIFRSFIGGPIGAGNQGMSWIHRDDLVRGFLFLLDSPQTQGRYNFTAPNPVTNRDFSKILGESLGRPHSMWTPVFAIRALFGEGATVVTEGQMVIPKKLLDEGFTFQFAELRSAFQDLLKK
ncbi:MAG: TIGR01777 family oxidoreductase [Leptospira sp.]|nr:TIGR01777 family oxidoreductase [Leptospira sp.]